MGELHLEILVDRMMREFNVQANVGKRQVAYRETIRKQSQAEGKYIRQTGAAASTVTCASAGAERAGQGYEFVNEVVGGVIPKEFIQAVDQGHQGSHGRRRSCRYEMVDVKATLYDGSYHDVDSNEMPSRFAGRWPSRKRHARASPVLLEPVDVGGSGCAEEYMERSSAT